MRDQYNNNSDDLDLSIEGYNPSANADETYYQPEEYAQDDDVAAPYSTPARKPRVTTPVQREAAEPAARPAYRRETRRPVRTEPLPEPELSETKAPETEEQRETAEADKNKGFTPIVPLEKADIEEKARKEEAKRAKKQRRENGERRPYAIVRFFTDERTRVFLALALVILSIFVMTGLVSHFKHGAHDQSAVTNLALSEIAENPDIVDNATGGFGAWVSKVLLCDGLGLGAIMLIVYLWILGLGLLGMRKFSFWGTTFRCLLLAITISIVLGLVTYDIDSTIYWGGNHGHYINKFLLENTTWIGASMVSLLLVVAVCCVYLNELRAAWQKMRVKEKQEPQEEPQEAPQAAQQAAQQAAPPTPHVGGSQPGYADESNNLENSREASTNLEKSREASKNLEGNDGIAQRPANNERQNTNNEHQTATPETEFEIDTEAGGADLQIDIPKPETDEDIVIDDSAGEIRIGDDFVISTTDIEEADKITTGGMQPSDGKYDHRAELSRYRFPDIELLEDRPSGPNIDIEEQQANKERIEKTLLDYKIPISRIEATVGPTVTLYEIVPAEGVRISQIKRLEDDIALSLSALGIRIIAPIPGKGTVGIEVPNNDPQTVSMRSVIASKKYQECKMALPMALGATIENDIFIADLAKMPHLLVAGATGMGKSVGLNAIITSLIYKKHPTELKFVLVDPKMVEFSLYSKLERHYLAKLQNEEDAIITDMGKVVETLNSLCVEMDNRYELLRNANVRSLEEYNKKFSERRLNPEKGHKYLPYIVVIVDEFADLIMTQGKEVETPIARIAQKARAVGIHMILATQRPSTNVITGLIKANFPGRIAFRVIQMVDSRTILDCPGANQLIGRGDMLFSHNGIMERVQCAFISTEEVTAVTQFVDDQIGFEHAYYLPEYVPEDAEGGVIAGASTERDTLFDEAARFVVSRNMGSTSSLQRQFGIGYNRAGKLMDQLEAAGIVGPVNGSKPRNILVDMMRLESILGSSPF